MHGWCPQLFKKMGNKLGKVIEVDLRTIAKEELRRGWILIDTPISSRINRCFKIKMWETVHPIHVLEAGIIRNEDTSDFASMVGDPPDSEESELDEFSSDEEVEETVDLNCIIDDNGQMINEINEGLLMRIGKVILTLD